HAEATEYSGLHWRARLAHSRFLFFRQHDWSPSLAARLADQALPILEVLDDDEGLAIAWRLKALAASVTGQYAGWAAAAERSVEFARRAGDRDLEVSGLGELTFAQALGPTPVQEAILRCQAIL